MGLCRSHRLPVMARTRSDEARCDGCPHGSSCVNGWLFNLCLKRRFQGSRTKDERTRSAAMMLTGRISPPEGEVCRKFGNLRWFKWGCCRKSSGCWTSTEETEGGSESLMSFWSVCGPVWSSTLLAVYLIIEGVLSSRILWFVCNNGWFQV